MNIMDLAALTLLPMGWATDPNDCWLDMRSGRLSGYISPFAMVHHSQWNTLEKAMTAGVYQAGQGV